MLTCSLIFETCSLIKLLFISSEKLSSRPFTRFANSLFVKFWFRISKIFSAKNVWIVVELISSINWTYIDLLLLKTDNLGLSAVPETLDLIEFLILDFLCILFKPIVYYLAAVLPSFLLISSPLNLTPFPL